MIKSTLNGTYKLAKRTVIAVVGGTILLLGVLMLVTPGPGLAAIAVGLGILAIEFAWARAWLKSVRRKLSAATTTVRDNDIESHRS
jgi:tellurite resistance protein TerC